MVSEARLYGTQQIHGLTVPGSAIVRDAHGVENVYVYYPSRQKAFVRRIETGDFCGSEVVIKSGLAPNDQVVIVGQQNLREGSSVLVVGGAK